MMYYGVLIFRLEDIREGEGLLFAFYSILIFNNQLIMLIALTSEHKFPYP